MKKRILLCDDDRDIGEVTALILEKGGYDVRRIASGKGIRKVIKDYHPDLLLLDVMIPEEDGTEIAKNLKTEDETKYLPVLLFTAVSNPEDLILETLADGFVAKPYEMKELLMKVESCV